MSFSFRLSPLSTSRLPARLLACFAVLTSCLALLATPAASQERFVRVGVTDSAVLALVEALAPTVKEQTGITVRPVVVQVPANLLPPDVDAILAPERVLQNGEPAEGVERQAVFLGDAVLIGSRAERARVRGLNDVEQAFRWIASARGSFVSSSPQSGLRDLELSVWGRVGVNVRTRQSWYLDVAGDERTVMRRAGELGAYALVERSTFLATLDRRGLEILVQGDPRLQTVYTSVVRNPGEGSATEWHRWLVSEAGREAINRYRLNGVEVFRTAADRAPAGRPS